VHDLDAMIDFYSDELWAVRRCSRRFLNKYQPHRRLTGTAHIANTEIPFAMKKSTSDPAPLIAASTMI
jgi:hypothetical protein